MLTVTMEGVKDIRIGLYHMLRLTRVYTQPRVMPLYYELLIYTRLTFFMQFRIYLLQATHSDTVHAIQS